MSNTKKVLWGIGIIFGVIIVTSMIDSNSDPTVSPSQSSNQDQYNPLSKPTELNTIQPSEQNSYNLTPEPVKLNPIEVKQQPNCHPSYSGVCLNPNANDYDCAGGSGNGPYYTGRVRVVGPDVFGLDRDKDGWGCE